jgi:hypothetical protein
MERSRRCRPARPLAAGRGPAWLERQQHVHMRKQEGVSDRLESRLLAAVWRADP